MVFWFVLRAGSTFRFVEPVIRVLASDGHSVLVSFALPSAADEQRVRDAGAVSVQAQLDTGTPFARMLDLARNLASYAALRRRWPPLLRQRWFEYFPSKLGRAIRIVDHLGLGRVIDSGPLPTLLARLVDRAPVPGALERQINEMSPDIVVATPMIAPGSREVDAIRAAKSLGVGTVGLVLSWDNLTSKGRFHGRPDRLFVWNEAQVREAIEWHNFDSSRVDALGAPVFDYVFEPHRRRARAEALKRLGVPPGDRYVVYGGSSRLGLGPGGEVRLVRRLQAAIRGANWGGGRPPALVVRPHPANLTGWDSVAEDGVRLWSRPQFPESEEGKNDLVATLFHADAVVGLNTSLFIDAAILGTPTIALVLGDREVRGGAPSQLTHFDHLSRAGFLELVAEPEEASAVLCRLRSRGDDRQAARLAFVERFIRPCGLDSPAAIAVAKRLASLG